MSDFFDYDGDKHMPVNEFLVGFQSRLNNNSKFNVNDELKVHLLFKQANLDSLDCSVIMDAAGDAHSP